MKSLSMFGLVTFCLLAGCSDKTPKTGQSTNAAANTPADAPANYLGGMASAQDKAVGTIDLASLNQAVQLFNVDNGRYPKDLDELVKAKLIGKVPYAPRGKKISYDAATGTVKLVDAQ